MSNPRQPSRGALVVAAVFLVVACRPAPSTAPSPRAAPAFTAVELPPPVGPSSAAAIEAARADSALHPYVKADIDFMAGMIGHHAQAIQMSNLAPTRGASPAVQRLAARIINAQVDEIATLQTWLADRQLPVPDARQLAGEHAHHGGAKMMPGMLTPEQMEQLIAARGERFDELYLRFMIQHHQGAVTMVTELLGAYGATQNETVFKLATDVNVDQTTEISRMQLMLAEIVFKTPAVKR